MRKPILFALTSLLAVMAVGLMTGLRPTAGLAATSLVPGRVIDQAEFPGGRAMLVEQGATRHSIALACQWGPFWRSCGMQPLTVSDDMAKHEAYWQALPGRPGEGVGIFAGIIYEPLVKRVEANGQVREIGSDKRFLFAWPSPTSELTLEAKALKDDGLVLYELGAGTSYRWKALGVWH